MKLSASINYYSINNGFTHNECVDNIYDVNIDDINCEVKGFANWLNPVSGEYWEDAPLPDDQFIDVDVMVYDKEDELIKRYNIGYDDDGIYTISNY